MTIELNNEQLDAAELATDWFRKWQRRENRKKQVFFLSGGAGTGKTTLAQYIVKACGLSNAQVAFIAPTGKAASRLKQKGCTNARTLHQFVYNYRGEDEDGEMVFVGKGRLDERPQLVVCDEVSMLGEYDSQTLLKHGFPVLALGDIGQLPPVRAAAAFTEDHVDFLLTQIMRQAEGSNIIRAAGFVRDGHRLPFREYEDVRVRGGMPSLDDLIEHVDEDSVILCSYNNTRNDINKAIRKDLGYTDRLPMVGEKIVCLFNQHGYGIQNGEQGIVIRYETQDAKSTEDLDDEDDLGDRVVIKSLTDGKERRVRFQPKAFSANYEERQEYSKKPGGFDFGYALTIHKSQGSEWSKVLVMEEPLRGVDYAKLMYTAVTRATDRLTIYRP